MKLYVLFIPLLAAMACSGVSQLEYDDLSNKQAATTVELETALNNLKAAELNLQTVEEELEKAKTLLEEKESELERTQRQYDSLRDNADDVRVVIEYMKKDSEMAEKFYELGLLEIIMSGDEDGLEDYFNSLPEEVAQEVFLLMMESLVSPNLEIKDDELDEITKGHWGMGSINPQSTLPDFSSPDSIQEMVSIGIEEIELYEAMIRLLK